MLLVDDDESLRRALARTTRLVGFEVEAFQSVEALIADGVPETDACLVLDVDLPGIGGIEFKRALWMTPVVCVLAGVAGATYSNSLNVRFGED